MRHTQGGGEALHFGFESDLATSVFVWRSCNGRRGVSIAVGGARKLRRQDIVVVIVRHHQRVSSPRALENQKASLHDVQKPVKVESNFS